MTLLNIISVTEDIILQKRIKETNDNFGKDALFAYNNLYRLLLENCMKKEKCLTVNIYELDYLLSAIEIKKDLINEYKGKNKNNLTSLFNKVYKKHKKHKSEIIDFYSNNNEIERFYILKEIYNKKTCMEA